jgi:hypothetical protein
MDGVKDNSDWLECCNLVDVVFNDNEQNDDVFGFPKNVKLESDTLSAFDGKDSFTSVAMKFMMNWSILVSLIFSYRSDEENRAKKGSSK